MKYRLLCLLLLANVCTSTVLAWDIHPDALSGHDPIVLDRQPVEPHTHAHTDSERHHANHSCHGAAHLTGCINETATLDVGPHRQRHVSPPVTLPFLYITPHLRPPIA